MNIQRTLVERKTVIVADGRRQTADGRRQ
ncbi:MAG: hypothetical protein ACI8V0_002491, partial [Pseudohongiellaceae bacterium]